MWRRKIKGQRPLDLWRSGCLVRGGLQFSIPRLYLASCLQASPQHHPLISGSASSASCAGSLAMRALIVMLGSCCDVPHKKPLGVPDKWIGTQRRTAAIRNRFADMKVKLFKAAREGMFAPLGLDHLQHISPSVPCLQNHGLVEIFTHISTNLHLRKHTKFFNIRLGG